MTESTDPQAVAPATEAQAQPVAEAPSAQITTPDLDALLGEFEAQTKPQPAPVAAQPQPTEPAFAQLQQRLDAIEREKLVARDKEDQARIIKEIAGDSHDPDSVLGFLSRKASLDPRINDIWNNRYSNPAPAKKLEAALRAEYLKEKSRVKEPDRNATEDRMAVAAAVRGTSTKVPEQPAPKYGELNDADFRKELAKYGL